MADHKTRDHALLSASGAHRWINCTPSALLEDKEAQTSSIYADEGTLAHELAETLLNSHFKIIDGKETLSKLMAIRSSRLYSSDMGVYIEKFVNFVLEELNESKVKTVDAIIIIEKKVSFEHLIKNGFGTCDVIIIADGVMKVIDLKYGQGVKVSAKENPQLMLYGSGAYEEFSFIYDIHTIQLIIAQPRLDNWSTYDISANDLITWGQKVVKPKAELATKGEGIQQAGEWCKFCKVKARCATLASQALKVAKHEFKDPHLLTDAQLLDVYKQIDLIGNWIKAVGDHVYAEALNGKVWPGYKLVEGRSNRIYKDETEVTNTLINEGFNEKEICNIKLKGITDITKLLGKSKFSILVEPFLIKPPGKPVLVSNEDKREALRDVDSAKTEFNID